MSGIPAKTRRMVELRSDGVCEGCGERPASEIHHRKYLSRGGKHGLENLLALCGGPGGLPGGNAAGCHGRAHTGEGTTLGWSVPSWDDEQHIPVMYRGVESWLTAWGSVMEVGSTDF